MLLVSISVPTKMRFFPFTTASRQPVPFVIRSPRFAFAPEIVIEPGVPPSAFSFF